MALNQFQSVSIIGRREKDAEQKSETRIWCKKKLNEIKC